MPAQVDDREPGWQVAECLLPGVIPAATEALARSARHVVRLRGLLLMPEDDVLLSLFAGAAAESRAIRECAGQAPSSGLPAVWGWAGVRGLADERAPAGGPPGIQGGVPGTWKATSEPNERPWEGEE